MNFDKLKKGKNSMFKFFAKKKIFLQQHYIPIFKFNIFNERLKNDFHGSNLYYKNAISLPIYFKFDKKQQNQFLNCLKSYISLYKK